MQASEVPRPVAAAMSIASALDLIVDDAVVLQNSNRLAVRLLPCDVLARIAALEPRAEPRAYERYGFVVTLWTYYEPVTPREVWQLVASRDQTPAFADADRELLSGMLSTQLFSLTDQQGASHHPGGPGRRRDARQRWQPTT